MSETEELDLDNDEIKSHPVNEGMFPDDETRDPLPIGDDGPVEDPIVTPNSHFTDAEWTIISGHRRIKAEKEKSKDSITVEVVEYDSKQKEREAVLLANVDRTKTPGEQVQLAAELEHLFKTAPDDAFPEMEKTPAVEAAERFDMSKSTYYDGRRVKQAAEKGIWGGKQKKSLPPEIKEKAEDQWRDLKHGDQKIGGAHTAIKNEINKHERKKTIKRLQQNSERNITFVDSEDTDDIKPLPAPIRAFPWYGNKANYADWIVSRMSEHETYVEPFAGNAAVLLNKPPSQVEVINDRDPSVVNFFEVVLDRPETLKQMAESFDFTKATFEELSDRWTNDEEFNDRVLQAATILFLTHAEFHGRTDTPATFEESKASSYYSRVEKLPELHKRLARSDMEYFTGRFVEEVNEKIDLDDDISEVGGLAAPRRTGVNEEEPVKIQEGDFEDVLREFESEDTLAYLDPPYEGTEQPYEGSFTKDDIQRLVNLLNDFDGDWILSYGAEPPEELNTDYIETQPVNRQTGKGDVDSSGEEWLVTNIPEERIGTFRIRRLPADEW